MVLSLRIDWVMHILFYLKAFADSPGFIQYVWPNSSALQNRMCLFGFKYSAVDQLSLVRCYFHHCQSLRL